MINVKVMVYWLMVHVLERKEVYYVEVRRDYIYYSMGLVRIVFGDLFVN